MAKPRSWFQDFRIADDVWIVVFLVLAFGQFIYINAFPETNYAKATKEYRQAKQEARQKYRDQVWNTAK